MQFASVSMFGELAASGHTDLEVTQPSADIMKYFIKTYLNLCAINIVPMCVVVLPVHMCGWWVFSL